MYKKHKHAKSHTYSTRPSIATTMTADASLDSARKTLLLCMALCNTVMPMAVGDDEVKQTAVKMRVYTCWQQTRPCSAGTAALQSVT